jgi:flagellin
LDITVSATISGSQISQTVNDVDEDTANLVNFNALGITLDINSALTTASNATIIATTATASDFQVGAKNVAANDRIGILLGKATSDALGLSKDQLDTQAEAQDFIDTVDSAISTLNTVRGDIGAAQNRLGYAAANLASIVENAQAAESVIRDVDMAAEMTTFTKNQILLQAGTAMLAQANMAPQQVLALFG